MLPQVWKVGTAQWGASRSITAETPRGRRDKGVAPHRGLAPPRRVKLGVGWKLSPSIMLKAATITPLAAVNGAGFIRHIWITTGRSFRQAVLRIYSGWRR